ALSRPALTKQRIRRAALKATQGTFYDWSRRKMIALTDEYREEIPFALEMTEIALRQIRRRPDLYPLDEKMAWARRLYAVRERQAALEPLLDIFTYDKYEL